MEVFDDRDAPYLDWLQSHPDGYVLNRRRGSSDNYLVLHRSACNKIRNYTQMARPGGFTGRGYIKVCSNDIESLHQYARNKGGPSGRLVQQQMSLLQSMSAAPSQLVCGLTVRPSGRTKRPRAA